LTTTVLRMIVVNDTPAAPRRPLSYHLEFYPSKPRFG
jgi:hypothetical protein